MIRENTIKSKCGIMVTFGLQHSDNSSTQGLKTHIPYHQHKSSTTVDLSNSSASIHYLRTPPQKKLKKTLCSTLQHKQSKGMVPPARSYLQLKNYLYIDLFPFANQCPRQAIQSLIDQSRQSALIPSSSQELFFLVPLG